MPTYADLERESWWRAEVAPPNLAKLITALQKHYGVGYSHIAARGDNNHLYGYHRSRAWILNSQHSRYRSSDYSVQHPLDKGGDANWYSAFDVNPGPAEELYAMCKRIDFAARAGRLEKVREWYGNFGDDDRVDGWDNIYDRVASSDSSHLFHLHGSIFRAHANDDHSDLLAVLIGEDMVNAIEWTTGWITQQISEMKDEIVIPPHPESGYPGYRAPNLLAQEVKAIRAAQTAPAPVEIDYAKLAEAMDARMEAAAERAVRKVLGAVDGSSPAE